MTMHHRAKMPFHVVQECRQLRERKGWPFSLIAKQYGVSQWVVRDWVEYRTRINK